MPWAVMIVGLGLIILALRPGNDLYSAASTFGNDIAGSDGFGKWLMVIAIIGAVGYLPDMRGTSDIFLVLCLVSFVLANSGVFSKAESALNG